MKNHKKTGFTRYRTNIFGKVILQVEVTGTVNCQYRLDDFEITYWRDAKRSDFSAHKWSRGFKFSIAKKIAGLI